MCFCNPDIRTPYCDNKKCQDELLRQSTGSEGEPVEYIISKDAFDKALGLLDIALRPKITFTDDLEVMRDRAKQESTRNLEMAYLLLSNMAG